MLPTTTGEIIEAYIIKGYNTGGVVDAILFDATSEDTFIGDNAIDFHKTDKIHVNTIMQSTKEEEATLVAEVHIPEETVISLT